MLWELGHRFECSLRIRWDSWYFLVVVQNDNLMLDIIPRNIKQIVGRGRCYPNNQKFEEPREGYKNYKNEWRTQEVMKLLAICILLVTVDWITLFLSVSLSQVSTSLFSTPFFCLHFSVFVNLTSDDIPLDLSYGPEGENDTRFTLVASV